VVVGCLFVVVGDLFVDAASSSQWRARQQQLGVCIVDFSPTRILSICPFFLSFDISTRLQQPFTAGAAANPWHLA
jgi:hypothetical protein